MSEREWHLIGAPKESGPLFPTFFFKAFRAPVGPLPLELP